MYATTLRLVADLRAGRTSARALVEQAIARIDSVDPAIHAVVVRDFERARLAAAQADEALARGERRPLLGIPMTVKECIDVAGLPTTWGIPGTERIPVMRDAVVVERLKAAGAVIVGKTNVPLNLADWQSYNAIYGTTNNPWNPLLTPGGSSGGSAAALAAGYVPLELGTDIGGSLRVPAHFCGVYSHKPTWGIVPMRGVAPPGTPALPTARGVDFAVTGPMARSAADLELALDVLAGPDEVAATAYRLTLPPARHERLADFRVLVLDRHPLVPTSHEVGAALRRHADRLASAGCTVATSSPLLPDLPGIVQTYGTLLMSFFGGVQPDAEHAHVRAAAERLAPDDRSPAAMQLRALVLSHRDWLRHDRTRAQIANRWRELFRNFDVVVCPVWPTPAFAHDQSADIGARRARIDGVDVGYVEQSFWVGLATLAGLPATTIPIGLGESGLPIGVQVIGPCLEDRTPLAYARLVEEACGGFVAPPGLPPGDPPP